MSPLNWKNTEEEPAQENNLWFAATIGLIGLIAGYAFGLLTTGSSL